MAFHNNKYYWSIHQQFLCITKLFFQFAVKPAHVVTSIKQSLAFNTICLYISQ